jgi:uncharacterized membrane protein
MDSTLNALAIMLHLVAINIWLGGTFFSVVVLARAVSRLDAPQQLLLMDTVLCRFFTLIWLAVPALLASGAWMVYRLYGGLALAPLYILLMVALGLSMMLVFVVTFFGPYRHYRAASQGRHFDEGRRRLLQMRRLSIASMVLGICIVLVIGGGPHLLN